PASQSKSRKRPRGKTDGGAGKFPTGRDTRCGSARRPLQNPFEAVPTDCGLGYRPPFSLPATSTWPSSERWSAKGNRKPTWRKPRLRQEGRRGSARRRRGGTSERTQCKWKEWKRRRASRFVPH